MITVRVPYRRYIGLEVTGSHDSANAWPQSCGVYLGITPCHITCRVGFVGSGRVSFFLSFL